MHRAHMHALVVEGRATHREGHHDLLAASIDGGVFDAAREPLHDLTHAAAGDGAAAEDLLEEGGSHQSNTYAPVSYLHTARPAHPEQSYAQHAWTSRETLTCEAWSATCQPMRVE